MAAKHQVIPALALALLALAGVRSAAALSAPPGLEGIWEADREALEDARSCDDTEPCFYI